MVNAGAFISNLGTMDDFFNPQKAVPVDIKTKSSRNSSRGPDEMKLDPAPIQVNTVETTNIQRKQVTVNQKEEEKPKGIKGKKRNRKQQNIGRTSDEVDEEMTKKKVKLNQNVGASSFAVRPSAVFSKDPSKLTRTAAGFRQ